MAKEEAVVEENVDETQYAPTETHALTPQEAATLVLNPPASAAPEKLPEAAPVSESLPYGVVSRTIEGGYITEVLDQKEGLPTAVNADEDYQARIVDASVDYTQTVKESDEGETVEK